MKRFIVLLVVLAGCGNIPTTGPVKPGLDIENLNSTQNVSTIAQAPRPGATQLEIVAGFLSANSSAIGDYSIAREYLADFVAAEWLPSAEVQVFETALNLEQINETTINAVGLPKLRLDEALRPKLSSTKNSQTIRFALTQDNGEWRITNPPAGIILPSTEFQRNYEISNLWFVDKAQSRLVPDFIAISQRLDAATQLIRALSNGSSNWLKPAVVNLLDPEISGGLASVQQISDRVVVDLEAGVLRLNSREQGLLVSQLAQTLQPLIGVSELEVTVGGQLLTVSGISNPLDLDLDSWPASRFNRSTNLYTITNNGQLQQPIGSLNVKSWIGAFPNASELTIAPDEQRIAIVIPDTNEIAVGYRSQNPRIIAQVSSLSDLNFDSNGTLWFVNQASRTLFGFDGTNLLPTAVDVPADSVLNHAVVGPDNIRVAVLNQIGQDATLSISRLVKSDRNFALRDRLRILTINGEVKNLNWYSATEVAMLVTFPNQSDPVAVIVNIATAAQTIVRLPSRIVEFDANGFGTLVAVDNQQRIWQRTNGTWEQIGTGRTASYPRQ